MLPVVAGTGFGTTIGVVVMAVATHNLWWLILALLAFVVGCFAADRC